MKHHIKIGKILFITLGCLCLALGTAGILFPILPTTPFYMATVFFFARSSERLNNWFHGTGLYKKHLESFVKKEGMHKETKISIMACVTLLMGFGFFIMARKGIWFPCLLLAAVWLAHIIYFGLYVKTLKNQ